MSAGLFSHFNPRPISALNSAIINPPFLYSSSLPSKSFYRLSTGTLTLCKDYLSRFAVVKNVISPHIVVTFTILAVSTTCNAEVALQVIEMCDGRIIYISNR